MRGTLLHREGGRAFVNNMGIPPPGLERRPLGPVDPLQALREQVRVMTRDHVGKSKAQKEATQRDRERLLKVSADMAEELLRDKRSLREMCPQWHGVPGHTPTCRQL